MKIELGKDGLDFRGRSSSLSDGVDGGMMERKEQRLSFLLEQLAK